MYRYAKTVHKYGAEVNVQHYITLLHLWLGLDSKLIVKLDVWKHLM